MTDQSPISRVTEQQEREALAHAERKRAIAKTPEVLAAFADGIDRKQPAPTPRG
jgi:hypothetical protein